MNSHDPFLVSLYIHGENLNPGIVTSVIGVAPTDSNYKGQKITTSKHREYIKRAAVWVLTASTKSDILSDHINELSEKIKISCDTIMGIDGVEDAYLDVFMCTIRSKDDPDSSYFELSPEGIATLYRLGLRVQFTVGTTEG